MKSVLLFVAALLSMPSIADFAEWDQVNNVKASPEFSTDGFTVTARDVNGDWERVPAVITTEQVFSGKHYWEMTVSCGPDSFGVVAGLATENPLIPSRPAIWDKGWGLMTDGTRGASNGSPFDFPDVEDPTTKSGDVLMFAYDADLGQFYLGKNGNWLGEGNPSTGSNPTFDNLPSGLYAALEVAPRECDPQSVQTNFGQSAFYYPVPKDYFEGLCPDGRCKISKGGGGGQKNYEYKKTYSFYGPELTRIVGDKKITEVDYPIGKEKSFGVQGMAVSVGDWVARGICFDSEGNQGLELIHPNRTGRKTRFFSPEDYLVTEIITEESPICGLEKDAYQAGTFVAKHRIINGYGRFSGVEGFVHTKGSYRVLWRNEVGQSNWLDGELTFELEN